MTEFNAYIAVIATSVIIILSYLFNVISKKTNIPSVLLLIILGVALKWISAEFGIFSGDSLMKILEILGIVGLTMIVLEAALDLELSKDKWPLIWKSFSIALLALGIGTIASAYVIQYFYIDDFFKATVYAVPLSIMSSAIVIPSVGALDEHKKEFMVYEATFSDILGIMLFYFLIGNADTTDTHLIVWDVVSNILITITLSIVISYGLVLIFQKLDTQVKLFLLISVLLLLYSIGKLFHLSSLIIILIFGLVLNNHKLFFFGKFKKMLDSSSVNSILHNFRLVTMESAFVVRTFFFVIFGMTITLATLFNVRVAIVSLILLGIMYGLRFVLLKLFVRKDILPQLFIAPRGLITILLFFGIPTNLQEPIFNTGVLLFIILITSIAMTLALVLSGNKIEPYEDFASNYWQQVDKEIDRIETNDKNHSDKDEENRKREII
ncbi:NhaP-type Na+/H+ or K+/H+ antiporter [Catalinimonas alkaloidigena]|uniref:cation:proton antiporter domain-containing protein n=1 Tax=Catalinimonas alkaloidigena TaxID=1075417 RepID=UPI002406048A|nr:cation:proton antiporter [Catalinimonas alkaloidigena]MDF9796069.1 NhaP-type Na+/H+ or K+/H+ antiporter [Catalinimonas alkaloidigena]